MYEFTTAADAIIARVADRLTASEISRMRSTLEIDLHLGERHAINRAMRNLESQRLGYRTTLTDAEVADLAGIREQILIPAPVAAQRDMNDVFKVIAATFASDTAPGYALHIEDVDHPSYRPYCRAAA